MKSKKKAKSEYGKLKFRNSHISISCLQLLENFASLLFTFLSDRNREGENCKTMN